MEIDQAFSRSPAAVAGQARCPSDDYRMFDYDLSALTSLTMVLASVVLRERPEAFAEALQLEYGRLSLLANGNAQEPPLLVTLLLSQLVACADDLRHAANGINDKAPGG